MENKVKLKLFTDANPSVVEKQFNDWVESNKDVSVLSVTTNVSPMHELVPGATPCVDITWQEFTATVIYQ